MGPKSVSTSHQADGAEHGVEELKDDCLQMKCMVEHEPVGVQGESMPQENAHKVAPFQSVEPMFGMIGDDDGWLLQVGRHCF